ncbi:hypothetical protein F753_11805 [Stutzerimonas chloritidismutans AW-1]|uniref:Uncharacterized protein n=1 Tax=Stutzerimonas chloritidismutans AW-1 TaxID=1263865 RepID=V4QC39_STUCH|nr:hypothetical protein F753_11805 [Stutzerimonas chloritidismutans AW-1]
MKNIKDGQAGNADILRKLEAVLLDQQTAIDSVLNASDRNS